MAYEIKGGVNAQNITVQGKTVGTTLSNPNGDVYNADSTGHIDLPVQQKPEIDYILNQFPLSQYGAINNNEPGVAGTFDGGSTVPYYSAMPVLLEEDGSLVYLRPGTNGSSINYYYTYINNPLVSMQPFTTINKYYEGSWKNILFSPSDTKTSLMYEEVGNNTIHVVLTNGTLDKTQHQEATFARNLIPYYLMYSLVVDTYMYIVTLYSSTYNYQTRPEGVYNPLSDPFEFILYRIPVSQIQAGNITTVEQVSGINGTTMYGDAVSSANYIRISDVWASTTSTSTKSFIKYDSAIPNVSTFTYSVFGMVRAIYDGTNIRISMSTNSYANNNTSRFDTRFDLTATYNVSTKAYTTNLTSTPMTVTGGATGTLTWTNPYSISSNNIWGSENAVSDSLNGTLYITNTGLQFFIREKYVLSDQYYVYRSQINNFTTIANAYTYRNRSVTTQQRYVVSQDFASRVGDQMVSCSPISSTRVMFTGTGTYNGVSYNKYQKGIADIGTTRTYTYNSFSRGTITGYAPQSYRVPMDAQNLLTSGLSFCDASGNVQFYGTAFVEDKLLTTGYKLDSNTLSFDKTFSISSTILINLKNAIISNLGLTATQSKIGLYYSPDTTYTKSIACVYTYNGSTGGNLIVATVDTTANSTNVLTATLSQVVYNNFDNQVVGIANDAEINRHAGLSCVKYGDFTYIAFSHLINIRTPGDTHEKTFAGVISGNTISSIIMNDSYHANDISATAREYGYIPNLGFGYFVFTNTDRGTKLIFKNCGNTLSQFNSNLANGTGTDVVILAQDVPQGFYLYFTEVTPLFMAGQYFDVPISFIDLDDVTSNPGNKTYYVYIQLVLGSPQYVASLTEIPESNTNMFIGTITTDGTKVSALNITKVSRFDLYRPSLTQIGSAFPVSSGNPAQTGSIQW